MEDIIFKVCAEKAWNTAQNVGRYKGAPIDLEDGYIHFSTAAQLAETLAKHFAGERDLMLVAVRTDAIGSKLRWEPSRGGDLFPHLYEDLDLHHVIWAEPLSLENGTHVLPDLIRE